MSDIISGNSMANNADANEGFAYSGTELDAMSGACIPCMISLPLLFTT
jgi:hypothetical protein